jgi:hypothetical protein
MSPYHQVLQALLLPGKVPLLPLLLLLLLPKMPHHQESAGLMPNDPPQAAVIQTS